MSTDVTSSIVERRAGGVPAQRFQRRANDIIREALNCTSFINFDDPLSTVVPFPVGSNSSANIGGYNESQALSAQVQHPWLYNNSNNSNSNAVFSENNNYVSSNGGALVTNNVSSTVNNNNNGACQANDRWLMSLPYTEFDKLVRCEAVTNKGYIDHSRDPLRLDSNGQVLSSALQVRRPRNGVVEAFPERLYKMLNRMDEEGTSAYISWQPHGRCFVVHNPKEFAANVMPKYFQQTKYSSFRRQLNLYGFSRPSVGPDRGGYYHDLFLRGRPDLCSIITRTRVKGMASKQKTVTMDEPNFYALPYCYERGVEDKKEGLQSNNALSLIDVVNADCQQQATFNPSLDVQDAKLTVSSTMNDAASFTCKKFEGSNDTHQPSLSSLLGSNLWTSMVGNEDNKTNVLADALRLGCSDHGDDEPLDWRNLELDPTPFETDDPIFDFSNSDPLSNAGILLSKNVDEKHMLERRCDASVAIEGAAMARGENIGDGEVNQPFSFSLDSLDVDQEFV